MLCLCISCSESQKMHATAKQKRDDVLALMLQLNSYYFDDLNCFSPISILTKIVFSPDLCLMMSNNRSPQYTLYRQRHISEYSEAA